MSSTAGSPLPSAEPVRRLAAITHGKPGTIGDALERVTRVAGATPAGSTAYNRSNGGQVLVWGLEAMAVSFLAPHSLHVRPLVVPRGLELALTNESADVPGSLLVDGHSTGELSPGDGAWVRVDEQASLLARLPEAT